MNKRDTGKEILEGLKDIAAWQRGAAKLKTTRIEMPTAKDVAVIRKRLGLSQEAFAAFLGVSIGTLRNWEQSRREPHGAARCSNGWVGVLGESGEPRSTVTGSPP